VAKNTNMWPKMTQNSYFGLNLAVLGSTILIFTGGSISFGTHKAEKNTKNANIWPKMPIFSQKCQYVAKNVKF